MKLPWRKKDKTTAGRLSKPVRSADDLSPDTYKEGAACRFSLRYSLFKGLLADNNRALEIMAELQSKMHGQSPFDRDWLKDRVTELEHHVGDMVASLKQMGPGRYDALDNSLAQVRNRVLHALRKPMRMTDGPAIVWFEDIDRSLENLAGVKAANLGEMFSVMNLPVPHGFALTASAYKYFMDYNQLLPRLRELIGGCDLDDTEKVLETSKAMRLLVLQADLPKLLSDELSTAISELSQYSPVGLALRSSALMEDNEPGLAGQYETLLNVPPEEIPCAYKRVLASQFNPQALRRAFRRDLKIEDLAMGVAVMAMAPAQCSGVLYSLNPNDPQSQVMMISAVRGLGSGAVGGTVSSSMFITNKQEPIKLLIEDIIPQETMVVPAPESNVYEVNVPEDDSSRPCLTRDQVLRLAQLGLELERHYDSPVDVEWVLQPDGEIRLLQVRPLRIIMKDLTPADYSRQVMGHRVLLQGGITASPGVESGQVVHVKDEEEITKVADGDIIVAPNSLPEYALALDHAGAVVTEVGGAASHLAAVAREVHVPALFGVENASALLEEGTEVTVDADRQIVYEGKVESLIRMHKRRLLALSETPAFQVLDKVLAVVTPLHMTDPRSPDFKPESCRTMHDITRFSHEMAVSEMFRYAEEKPHETEESHDLDIYRLVADFPLELLLIDIGGGLKNDVSGDTVTMDQILSTPMRALVKGLVSIPWRGPGPAAPEALAKSKETRLKEAAQYAARPNYAILSLNYLNLSSRLGFHFSTLDTYCSDETNDNYIRFMFNGGGADPDRRRRRTRFVGEVLMRSGFRVKLHEDQLQSRVDKYPRNRLKDMLAVIGRLWVYTRQMDMLMFSDAVVDWYIEEFMRQYGVGGRDI